MKDKWVEVRFYGMTVAWVDGCMVVGWVDICMHGR